MKRQAVSVKFNKATDAEWRILKARIVGSAMCLNLFKKLRHVLT